MSAGWLCAHANGDGRRIWWRRLWRQLLVDYSHESMGRAFSGKALVKVVTIMIMSEFQLPIFLTWWQILDAKCGRSASRRSNSAVFQQLKDLLLEMMSPYLDAEYSSQLGQAKIMGSKALKKGNFEVALCSCVCPLFQKYWLSILKLYF